MGGETIPTAHKQAVAERMIAGNAAISPSLSAGLIQNSVLELQRSFHGAMSQAKKARADQSGAVAASTTFATHESLFHFASYAPGSGSLLLAEMNEYCGEDDDDGWDDEDGDGGCGDDGAGGNNGDDGGSGDNPDPGDGDVYGYDTEGDEYEELWPDGTVTVNCKTMSMCSAFARLTALGSGSFAVGLTFLRNAGTPYAPVILGIEADPLVLILVVGLLAAYAGYLAATC